MPRPQRAAALVAALALVACGAEPAATIDPHPGHSAGLVGASGTPHPSVPVGADGSIALENDFAAGGNGVRVAEALEVASSSPVLVIGMLLRDADAGIWFCDALAEGDPRACGRPRLWVMDFPADQAVFEPERAESTGAQTAGGVIWVPNQQLFGVVHPAP